MQHLHPINPHRLRAILAAVGQDPLLAHTLDHLLADFQTAPFDATGHPTFARPLADWSRQLGLPSVRALQNRLKKLEQLGLIARRTRFLGNTKQSVITMTDAAISQLLPLDKSGKAPVMWQATTRVRYAALLPLLPVADKARKPAVLMITVLNQLLYWIARDANQQGLSVDALESCYCACRLQQLAEACGLGVRALQRVLSALAQAGLIATTKKRTFGPYVETRYTVPVIVWEALKRVKPSQVISPSPQSWRGETVSPKAAPVVSQPISQQSMEVLLRQPQTPPPTPPRQASLPWEADQPRRFGSALSVAANSSQSVQKVDSSVQKFRRVANVHRNKNIDNIYNINNTARARVKMVDSPSPSAKKVNQEKKGGAGQPPLSPRVPISELPLDTRMGPDIPLNRRQVRYVLGMLGKMKSQHHCQFSAPDALFHEICFALQQVDHIFAGKTGFCHRLNNIAKLLKQNRWSTPYGYERYDDRGKAAKRQREAKEKAWQEQKAQERQEAMASRTGRTQRLSTALAKPKPMNASVKWRIREMHALAQRAKEPNCSAEALAGIRELMLSHQHAILQQGSG